MISFLLFWGHTLHSFTKLAKTNFSNRLLKGTFFNNVAGLQNKADAVVLVSCKAEHWGLVLCKMPRGLGDEGNPKLMSLLSSLDNLL